jgi:arabinogalactan oligomer / maltooligosaccharide transport system permease protein
MSAPAPAPSHRRRFLVGLAVAALLGVGAAAFLLYAARAAEARERAERRAVVLLSALTEVVERAGAGRGEAAAPEPEPEPEGDEGGFGLGIFEEIAEVTGEGEPAAEAFEPGGAVRLAVARFAEDHPEVEAVRVVSFEGILLEASTAPEDAGEKAAPRRLELAEKGWFDLGQELRGAVAANRAGGGPREPEIAAERLPGGGLSLAAPVERDGEVVGLVQLETARLEPRPAFPWLPFLAAWLLPVALFAGLSIALGERRTLLAAAALALLAAAVLGFGRWSLGVLEADRRATAEAVAAMVSEEAERAGTQLEQLRQLAGLPPGPGLEPWAWDVDVYRQPRGVVTPEGTVDEGRLGETLAARSGRMTRSAVWVALFAAVVLALIGLGVASRAWGALLDHRHAYAYTVPAMLGMLLLVFFPFLYGIALSFTNANIYNSSQSIFELWVGFDNFVDILTDVSVFATAEDGQRVFDYSNFYWTLWFTVIWTISNVTIGVTLGLLLALTLNIPGFALRPIYRVLLILPWAVPNYITALIFRGMFHKQFGVINQILAIFGGDPVSWFDRPLTSFLAVLTANGWLSFPFMMVVSLGALQSIPAELYEAARVDGASRWQQFQAITLPSLKPALVPAVILSVIWTFNQFNIIYLVSAGEPAGATEILITQSYKLAFEQYRYGYAAAYSTVIFLILLGYGVWQNRITRATEAIGG